MRNSDQINDLVEFCKEFLVAYDLPDWTLVINKRYTRTLGSCSYYKKRIHLSYNLLRTCTEDVVYKVIMHEIAHALLPDEGHSSVFNKLAKCMGGFTGTTTRVKIL